VLRGAVSIETERAAKSVNRDAVLRLAPRWGIAIARVAYTVHPMSLSLHSLAIETFVPTLRTLSKLLDMGAAHAAEKKFDPTVLVQACLAPDMLPLAAQVRLACHHARDATSRLAGKGGTTYGGNDVTIDEMKVRIEQTIEFMRSTPVAAFEGAEDREVVIPVTGYERDFHLKGFELLRDWSLPHFYFHYVTAYDILRHNGVLIGKRDYMSHISQYIRPRAV
jgi:hypothetical protein